LIGFKVFTQLFEFTCKLAFMIAHCFVVFYSRVKYSDNISPSVFQLIRLILI